MFIEYNENIKEPAFMNIRYKTAKEKQEKLLKLEDNIDDKKNNSID